MENWLIGLISWFGAFAVIFLFCWLLKDGFGSGGYYQKLYERGKRRRWNKYVKSLDPTKEEELVIVLKNSSDAEFEIFLKQVGPKLSKRYRPSDFDENTLLKRAMYNAINKHTDQFEYKRVKQIEANFPMLKRVYFGPGLNSRVYNKRTIKRKFNYTIKADHSIPKLDTIVDVAYFLNTSVNNILGLCYTQSKKRNPYYIKREYIYKALKGMGLDPDLKDVLNATVDGTFVMPDPKIFSKKSKKNNVPAPIEITEEPKKSPPPFEEFSSPFYRRKILRKPDGRKRLIASPAPFLKKYQKKILEEILEKVELPSYCTGFVKNRSIVSNAEFHVRSQTLVKIDLQNFFNSMKFTHAYYVFRGFGYNRSVSGILACICTDWYIRGGRYVPQGAPSSPMIGNLYCKNLDIRLKGLWTKKGFVYSRYADDLTFSSPEPKVKVRGLLHATKKIIYDEKLRPNYKKIKVYRKQHRKSVTGITVNDKININRKWINYFRGELHRYSKFGLPADKEDKLAMYYRLKGKLAFLRMVNPEKAKKYRVYFDKISID